MIIFKNQIRLIGVFLAFITSPMSTQAASCTQNDSAFACYQAALSNMVAVTKRFELTEKHLKAQNTKLTSEVRALKTKLANVERALKESELKSTNGIAVVKESLKSNNKKITSNVQSINGLNAFKVNLAKKPNRLKSAINVHSGFWGAWTPRKFCPAGQYVCGLRSRVEPKQHKRDDTVLNSVELSCCGF